mmetsp:Transcript_37836/g.84540  ORF Transcript_37836/g.84540 Transcript_37836/m.84540 type:complete len:212 (+) Transcript_37836:223-858(+)
MMSRSLTFACIVLYSKLSSLFRVAGLNVNHNVSEVALTKSELEALRKTGCELRKKPLSSHDIEARKRAKSLKFAVVYSGQVCHGRAADILWHPANMARLWSNQVRHLHEPLAQWGEVQVFGLFEEAAPPPGKSPDSQEARKARGCNDFASLANWTRLDFMPSEQHVNRRQRAVAHGEQRRASALLRFLADARSSPATYWDQYDFVVRAAHI